jgi:hypothetical protein
VHLLEKSPFGLQLITHKQRLGKSPGRFLVMISARRLLFHTPLAAPASSSPFYYYYFRTCRFQFSNSFSYFANPPAYLLLSLRFNTM